MKKILLGFLFAFFIFISNAQVLVYEPFNYNVGDTLPSPAWTGVNTGDQIFITSGSLNYTGLAPSIGNKISFDGGGRDYQRTVTAQTSGTVYMSFILQVTDITTLDTNGSYFSGFASGTATFGATVWSKKNSAGTAYRLGFNPRSTAANTSWSTTDMNINTPVFVVVSYQLVAGAANDIVNIWINPDAATFNTASAPTTTFAITNAGTDLTQIDRFFVRQAATATTPFIDLDEFRLGLTWADVTPVTQASVSEFSFGKVAVFPNPAVDIIKMSFNEPVVSASIVDIYGRIVGRKSTSGNTEIEMEVSSLPSGMYDVVAKGLSGKMYFSKFIK